MTTRTIYKALAGDEDLALGEGTVSQQRAGGSYDITKVRRIQPVNSLEELNALDTERYVKAALYLGNSVTFFAWTGTEWQEHNTSAYVNNYDALRALATTPGPVIQVLGHTQPGDGGEGTFWLDSADLSSADNQGTVLVDASGNRWKRLFVGRASVKWFGAIGDGAANDTAKVLAAATAQKELFFPPGVYNIADLVLPNGLNWSGVGEQSVLADAGSTVAMISDTSAARSVMRDLSLAGNASAFPAVLHTNNSSVKYINVNQTNWQSRSVIFGQNVEDISVEGGRCYAMSDEAYTVKGSNCTIANVVFSDIVGHAIRFGRFYSDADQPSGHWSCVTNCVFAGVENNAVLYELDSANGVISNCVSTNSRGLVKVESNEPPGDAAYAISILNNIVKNPAGVPVAGIDGNESVKLIVIGNHIDSFFEGISAGANSIISNNIVEGATSQGIRCVGDDVLVNNNLVLNAGDIGIDVENGSRQVVKNNVVKSAANYGINCSATVNSTISSNIIDSAGSIGIRLVGTVSDSFVTDNKVTNTATAFNDAGVNNEAKNNYGIGDSAKSAPISSGAITVANYDKFVFVDTEAAAASDDLVSILNGSLGQILVLRSQSSARTVTVKDGTGNLRLAGNADFTLGDTTDILTLVFTGTNWSEVSRSDN